VAKDLACSAASSLSSEFAKPMSNAGAPVIREMRATKSRDQIFRADPGSGGWQCAGEGRTQGGQPAFRASGLLPIMRQTNRFK